MQRVLVVGASRGIGRAIGLRFAAGGARVAFVARSLDDVRAVADQAGDGAVGVAGDVGDPASCSALVDESVEALGGLDVLVYSAALLPLAPLASTPTPVWDAVMATNVRGAALTTAAALPALRATGGRAAYLSSDAVGAPRTGLAAYAVSKAALDQLVECWRLEEPDVSFTRVTCGPTLTTIATGWDMDLAARYFGEWMAADPAFGTAVLTAEDVADRVVTALMAPDAPAVLDVLPA